MHHGYPHTMRAIVAEKNGPPSVLEIKEDYPTPEAKPDLAVIKVKAFGINYAEKYMRAGDWPDHCPINGIECVGVVVNSESTDFPVGTAVAALMGGMGLAINGSYAEYTAVPLANIVKLASSEEELLKTGLSWAQVAAIPETYATAWTCLFRNLEIKKGDRLLIRAGTSALGRAAINLAVQAGAEVTATTRKAERAEGLKKLGAKDVILESEGLSSQVLRGEKGEKFDAIYELVGNSVVLDSLKLLHRGGRLCMAGFLGGLDPIKDFNPLWQMASGVHFSFFGSFVYGQPEFPMSDVPLADIVRSVAEGTFNAEPWKVFKFEEIQQTHELMDKNEAGGKMVVVVEEKKKAPIVLDQLEQEINEVSRG
ncbi:NAD(P)-binding protein [Rhizodiscina lignyota]|uniref:NAD(P)-binding protein n=1 Tax=Rhizodiscina lignyota TaxID=1504668 RepID=A0A9P4IDX7_9PEZI|nr:NAD(P)-binding protein [Rhizodiscina lignyota]